MRESEKLEHETEGADGSPAPASSQTSSIASSSGPGTVGRRRRRRIVISPSARKERAKLSHPIIVATIAAIVGGTVGFLFSSIGRDREEALRRSILGLDEAPKVHMTLQHGTCEITNLGPHELTRVSLLITEHAIDIPSKNMFAVGGGHDSVLKFHLPPGEAHSAWYPDPERGQGLCRTLAKRLPGWRSCHEPDCMIILECAAEFRRAGDPNAYEKSQYLFYRPDECIGLPLFGGVASLSYDIHGNWWPVWKDEAAAKAYAIWHELLDPFRQVRDFDDPPPTVISPEGKRH